MIQSMKNHPIVRLFRDETGGEKDNINTLLIMALIVLPLLILLIAFKDDVLAYFQTQADDTFTAGNDQNTYTPTNN